LLALFSSVKFLNFYESLIIILKLNNYFYPVKKKKNDEHVLNSFKALVSGSPLTPANFGYMAKSSQGQRPPALIQGMLIKIIFI